MLRVVFDTNILISYLLTNRPPIAILIDQELAAEHFTLVTAPALLTELDRVLRYPKLQRYYNSVQRKRFVALLMSLSELVELPPGPYPAICRDPDDDLIIACALAGQADLIVSGDDDLLSLQQVGGISILSATEFLARLT